MPHGVPDAMTVVGLHFKIIQTPNVMIHLYEEFHRSRQIHTDRRPLPVDPDAAWYGYSVGRWEGETFVVESAGFTEGSWLDNDGHPHTEALRTTERFRRMNFGSMALEVTIDDPKAYSRLWTSQTIRFVLQPDTEVLELGAGHRAGARAMTRGRWTLPEPWTHRTRPPLLGKPQNGFPRAPTGALASLHKGTFLSS